MHPCVGWFSRSTLYGVNKWLPLLMESTCWQLYTLVNSLARARVESILRIKTSRLTHSLVHRLAFERRLVLHATQHARTPVKDCLKFVKIWLSYFVLEETFKLLITYAKLLLKWSRLLGGGGRGIHVLPQREGEKALNQTEGAQNSPSPSEQCNTSGGGLIWYLIYWL